VSPRLLIVLALVLVSLPINADDDRGKIVETSGEVYIVSVDGERRGIEEAGAVINASETIVTDENGHAVVSFSDAVLSVVDQNSRLQVEEAGWLSHLGGKIYFTYRKIFGEPRGVKTRFATLGIRGTTFIVYDDARGRAVALTEGLLDIDTPGPAFELYRQQQNHRFEKFKRQARQQQQAAQREFDDYRQGLNREFVDYKLSFKLYPSHIVRFDGNRVEEAIIDDRVQSDFEQFEAIAGEWLEEFREQATHHQESIKNQPAVNE